MGEARVKVSLTDGTIEFEGSEAFVEKQLAAFEDLIKARLKTKLHAKEASAAGAGDTPSPPSSLNGFPMAAPEVLDQVFAATDDGIQILAAIPGDSAAAKTVNAGMLLLFGLKALKQKDSALFEEVKAVCKAHGFYDEDNMAKNLKKEKGTFVFGGSGKKQTLRLTVPGAKATAALVQQLAAGVEA